MTDPSKGFDNLPSKEEEAFGGKLLYATSLLFVGEALLRQASIYVEDKSVLDHIDAHLERVDKFHNILIEEHKRLKDNDEKDR